MKEPLNSQKPPYSQKINPHKTAEINPNESNEPPLGMGNIYSPQVRDFNLDKKNEMGLESLPLSFVSQTSRQEMVAQLDAKTPSQNSSNMSVNSSSNEPGTNLRDAISNKKIMSYKLLSKVPGDRSSEHVVAQQQLLGSNDDKSQGIKSSDVSSSFDHNVIASPQNEASN
mmetsp:Transcript_23146/g.22620  ORF Transcript_23146/g.22620 Transcript_23146/m.22620 type:complete len:170 (+) Transcript_23146:799-1308(+)|eukprot:CAMPEP_0170566564 /NCGR_PEP_ID=MMETSP0211-20121228/79919_1 /TAXON_ID=311385 /ORGANISM="Pseudokeronopsis sp., Strain OXSARD2" /LENGTH=169 /DNA_ID=CAMNT_0010887781 /DNA_START=3057 /DNA_END=3566 /DNA_ORIENTATION=+